MSAGNVVDSINMVLLSVIAVLLVLVLLRQKKVKPLEGLIIELEKLGYTVIPPEEKSS